MSFIFDNFQTSKLKKYNINIATKYIVGNEIKIRNTDNSINDDVIGGIRCEKDYYLNNELVHNEKKFDSRIEYTFATKELESKDYTCPNCGMHSKISDINMGCPYCRTYYNIEYINKDLGSKYHYDRVLQSNKYRVITGIIDLLISIFICYIFIKNTSRTFNEYDVLKIFIYGIILSLILYYIFYILDAYIILAPIKIYKDRQNQKQIDFWNKTNIDKKTFFNNLNYELRKYYYSKENIIDFDVLDYTSFKDYNKNNKLCIKVCATVRIVFFENNKIHSKIIKGIYTLSKINNGSLKLSDGVNIIKCHNCGASIDATKKNCSYCNTEIKYLQEWILDDRN